MEPKLDEDLCCVVAFDVVSSPGRLEDHEISMSVSESKSESESESKSESECTFA